MKIFKLITSSVLVVTLILSSFASVMADADKGVTDFVTRCYELALGREPEKEGLNYWVNELETGKACGVSVAKGFVYSEEFVNSKLDDKTYVERMYNMLLGREPDVPGMVFWLDELGKGRSREYVFAGFANSKEFFEICENYGIYAGCYLSDSSSERNARINGFVDRLYQICLERHGDQGGQAYWVKSLAEGSMAGNRVAYGFIFSPEYMDKKTTNEEYITMLYYTFFDRSPDKAGEEYWLNELKTKYREDVFNGFANSPEFSNICSSFGIVCEVSNYIGCTKYVGTNSAVTGPSTNETSTNVVPSGGTFTNVTATVTPAPTPSVIPDETQVSYDGYYADSSSIPKVGCSELDFGTWGYSSVMKPSVNPDDYTYEVYPILGNFNEYFYIKTDNPDPWSFRLYDPESVYYTGSEDKGKYICVVPHIFPDVTYENPLTYRVKGGYIASANVTDFRDSNGVPYRTTRIDGGCLQLEYTDEYYFEEYVMTTIGHIQTDPDDVVLQEVIINRNTSYICHGTYSDSGKVIDVGPLVNDVDYLINNYTNPNASLFDNLDSVQSALFDIAVYPRSLGDDTVATEMYAYWAASPFPELSLNSHVELYGTSYDMDFLTYVYPFELHSQSFPNEINIVAMKLDSGCKISSTANHWETSITKDGRTEVYGGAGSGGYVTVKHSQIKKLFSFDQKESDFFGKPIEDYFTQYVAYAHEAYAEIVEMEDSLYSINTLGANSWIRVKCEASFAPYVYTYSTGYGMVYSENLWVDGRYLNINNYYVDCTFEESMQWNPSIYENGYIYCYMPEKDIWVEQNKMWKDVSLLDDIDYLTWDEVKALDIDRNHDKAPDHGLIYDGTAEPGTPF